MAAGDAARACTATVAPCGRSALDVSARCICEKEGGSDGVCTCATSGALRALVAAAACVYLSITMSRLPFLIAPLVDRRLNPTLKTQSRTKRTRRTNPNCSDMNCLPSTNKLNRLSSFKILPVGVPGSRPPFGCGLTYRRRAAWRRCRLECSAALSRAKHARPALARRASCRRLQRSSLLFW